MKLIYVTIICACVMMITACSSAQKATQSQGISGTVSTTAIPMKTAAPAIPTLTAAALPTTTSIPATEQAALPPTPTPLSSPSPTAIPPTEIAAPATLTSTPATQVPEETGSCTNIAIFNDDVTIPDGSSFRQGDTFVKTWRIRNAGTCDWDTGYSLVFASGELMDAPLTNTLPAIPHDTAADISVNLTAPARGGVYQSNWQFQSPDGQRFGVGIPASGLLWAQIAVSFVEPTQAAASDSPSASPGDQNAQSACAAQHKSSVDAQVLGLINAARENQGLDPLESQGQLAAAALAHSLDMACHDIVSHVGSDGSLWYNRVEAQGYANYNSARENIYVGNPDFGGTGDGAFNWWWNSQIHHDNMLNPNVSQIGVAYVYNPDSEYGGYYTTVFARP